MLNGLDLSGWQRSTPSLTGMSFLWAKATEGLSFVDAMYPAHTAAAKAAGIVHGAYHFGHTGLDPVAQARYLVAHAPDAQLYALDSEGASRLTHAEAAAFIAAVKVARPGVKVGLYESLSGYDQGAGQDFNWVAAWRSTAPSIPWTFWQYTSSGAVAGYSGRLDLDHFNGDLAALHRLAAVAVPAPAPKAFYTVVRGDTLSGIARAHGLTLAALLAFAENARYRANPGLIHPGDIVRVR